ncbi:MAG: T9SS type A sorting domain-containing protein [Bacteroidetes bacterium]|nr:T9SS type A sorting domain-containing protein [Bacteroidota bacterium]
MRIQCKIKSILFLLLLIIVLKSNAQIYFNNRYNYNGFGGDAPSIIAIDSGYLAAGGSYTSTGISEMGLLRIDSLGNLLWKKSYAKPFHYYYGGYPSSLIQTTDGGFAFASIIEDTLGNDDIIFFRFNKFGDTLWTKQIGTTFFDLGAQCRQTLDKGFVIVGTKGMSSTNIDATLIKMDSLGNIQWQKNYGGTDEEYGYSVELTPDGGYIIGSYTKSFGSGDFDTYIVKADSNGNQQWQKVLGGLYFDAPAVVKNTADGNYIVGCGKTIFQLPPGLDQAKIRVLKMNSSGGIIWDKLYGTPRLAAGANNIHELPDGSIIVGGLTTDTVNSTPVGNGFPQGFILKLNSLGDSIWYRNYKKLTGGYSENYLMDIKPTSDDGFVCSGFVSALPPDTPAGQQDAWIFKVDGCGCLIPNCDSICNYLGVNPVESNNQDLIIYPNPTQSQITIEFNIFEEKNVSIEIKNILGQVVKSTDNKAFSSGLNKIEIDLSELSSGLFFAQIQIGNKVISKKIIRI